MYTVYKWCDYSYLKKMSNKNQTKFSSEYPSRNGFLSIRCAPIFLYTYTYIQRCLHTSRNSSSRFATDIEYASCILTFENPFNCASVLSISIVRCSTGRSGASTHANSRYRYIDRYMGARSIDSFCRQMNSQLMVYGSIASPPLYPPFPLRAPALLKRNKKGRPEKYCQNVFSFFWGAGRRNGCDGKRVARARVYSLCQTNSFGSLVE